MPRVALIHALAHSVAPINDALARDWPQCLRMNLLDDSLSADLARSAQGLDAAMTQRFLALADYAVGTGAQAILFTCSAFGPCIDAVKQRHAALPVLKPNEPRQSAWIAGFVNGLPKATGKDGSFCYMPNAAIGWKQPNGFYYPPAFHSLNIFFDNVDIRHFVISPLFQEGTLVTDIAKVSKAYCNWNDQLFTGFAGMVRR